MNNVKNSKATGMKCCVPSCPSRSSSRKSNGSITTYHPFPKRTKFREEWISALKDMELYGKIVESEGPKSLSRLFICSRHFSKEDFQSCRSPNNNGKGTTGRLDDDAGVYEQRSLKDNAIPSIFIERPVRRRSNGNNYCNGAPQVKQKAVGRGPTITQGSLVSENAEVPIAAVALCMKEAVTNMKIALQKFKNESEQSCSKSQTIVPPAVPSVVDVNSISIRTTRSGKPMTSPPSTVIDKKTIANPGKKRTRKSLNLSKSCSSTATATLTDNMILRVTRTLSSKVSHELSQCTSPSVKNVKASVRRPVTSRSVTLSDITSSKKPTFRRLSSRKSAPPIIYDAELVKIASQFRPKTETKNEPTATVTEIKIERKHVKSTKIKRPSANNLRQESKARPGIKIRNSTSFFKIRKTIRKAKSSLTTTSTSSYIMKPPIATTKKPKKSARFPNFFMPKCTPGNASDDSERKQAGLVQSMFSQIITKVLADSPNVPQPRRRSHKTSKKSNNDSSSNGFDHGIGMIGGEPTWEANDVERPLLNRHMVYKREDLSNGLGYQLIDMNVDSDDDDDNGEDAVGDPLDLYETNVNSRTVKVDAVDLDENEYGTPLLNGFGFDMDSNHDSLEHGIQNAPGKELLITPEGCEYAYASDASECADDNYYALIPKIEVNEVESAENASDGQAAISNSNIVKMEVENVGLVADIPVKIETSLWKLA